MNSSWSYDRFRERAKAQGLKGKIKLWILTYIGFFASWQEHINQQLGQMLSDQQAETEKLNQHIISISAQLDRLTNIGLDMEDQYTIADYKLNRAQIELMLYSGYSETDLEIFKNFRDIHAKAEKGFVTDVMGIRTRTSSLLDVHKTLDGQLLGYPIPCDYHSETIEWLGLAKSVLAVERGKFIALELGAGIGTWAISGAVLARLRGINDIHLTTVEADPYHFELMKQHFKDNGLNPDQHRLIEAAVGTDSGIAYWPQTANSSQDWGMRPILSDSHDSNEVNLLSDYRGFKFENVRKIPVVAVVDILRQEPQWDFIHIDIQGGETAICRAAINDLTSRVRWVVVATHSRKHDGDIFELFAHAGWVLEHEKPTRFRFFPDHASLEAMTTHDGTQVWRNLSLINL